MRVDLAKGPKSEVKTITTGFTVKKLTIDKEIFPFSESILVKGLTDYLAHADLLANPLSRKTDQP